MEGRRRCCSGPFFEEKTNQTSQSPSNELGDHGAPKSLGGALSTVNLAKSLLERQAIHRDCVVKAGVGSTVFTWPFAKKIDDGHHNVILSWRVAFEEVTTTLHGERVRRVWVVRGVGWVGAII